MGQARNKKAYYAVLVLAGLAWGADKAFFGATNPDQAAAASEYTIGAGEWTNESKEQAPLSIEMLSGASDRLEILEAAPDEAIDAFRAPKDWLRPVAKASETGTVEPATDVAAIFKKNAKLTGLSGSGDAVQAMVNGKMTAIGDSIDGFTLVSVDLRAREAVFHDIGGKTVTLNLAVGTSGNDGSKRDR